MSVYGPHFVIRVVVYTAIADVTGPISNGPAVGIAIIFHNDILGGSTAECGTVITPTSYLTAFHGSSPKGLRRKLSLVSEVIRVDHTVRLYAA